MECGVVQHYHADEGYGFLVSERDQGVTGIDETKLIYFHISNCDIQTPAPRAGEFVFFCRDLTVRHPVVMAITRTVPDNRPSSVPAPYRVVSESVPKAVPQRVAPMQQPDNSKIDREGLVDDRANVSVETLILEVDAKRQQLADTASFYEGGTYPRYVYVDLDNMHTSYSRAEHLVGRFPGATSTRELEISLEGFTRRIAHGELGSGVVRLVAFYSKAPEGIASKLRRMAHEGVQWDVRKHSGSTDATMQFELLNALRPCVAERPKTLVLVTGEAAESASGVGITAVMDHYRDAGWCVEVHAWLSTMAASYIEYQSKHPETMVVRPFDDDDVGEIIRPRDSNMVRSTARARPSSQRHVKPSALVSNTAYTATSVGQVKRSAAVLDRPYEVRSSSAVRSTPQQRKPTSTASSQRAQISGAAISSRHQAKVSSTPWNVRQQRDAKPQWSRRDRNKRTDSDHDGVFGTKSFAQAVGRAVDEVRATSHTTRVSSTSTPAARVTSSKLATSYRPEQYANIIRELDGPDGALYIPTGLAMLAKQGSLSGAVDMDSLRRADPDTQRLLLSMALNDEMDAATRRVLEAEEEPVF